LFKLNPPLEKVGCSRIYQSLVEAGGLSGLASSHPHSLVEGLRVILSASLAAGPPATSSSKKRKAPSRNDGGIGSETVSESGNESEEEDNVFITFTINVFIVLTLIYLLFYC
jgi:hypothetical protein